jgi:hypothetical protein
VSVALGQENSSGLGEVMGSRTLACCIYFL